MKTITTITLAVMLMTACQKDNGDLNPVTTSQTNITASAMKTRQTREFEITMYTTPDSNSTTPPTPCSGDLPGFAIAGLVVHGNASQMGLIDASQSRLEHVNCNLSFTTALLTTGVAGQLAAANGDLVYYTGNDEINVFNLLTSSGTTGPITGVWTITGGTGRFTGATGSFNINGTVDFTTSTFSGSGLGTITY